MKTFNIYLTGVGGQGIGLLSEVVLRAADHAGHPVKSVDTHGLAQRGDLLLGRPVEISGRFEFSTLAAYLPQDEIADLGQKLEEARAVDAETYPEATEAEFLRRHGYLIIHHALEQAVLKGRPPVAAQDEVRSDKLVRKATRRLRGLQERLG